MDERERVIEAIDELWARNQMYSDVIADNLIAANLIRGEKPIIDMQKLRGAIEAGDDAYKSSKQHGQAWWLDCIEGTITPVLREMGFEVEDIESQGDESGAFCKTSWDLKALLALPIDERNKILEDAAEKGAHLYAWAEVKP